MLETAISDGPNTCLKVSARGVRGYGRLVPRLIFDLDLRTPRERMEVHVQHMQARLVVAGDEVAGLGSVSGVVVGPSGTSVSVDVPVSAVTIDAAETQLVGDRLSLRMELSGLLLVRDDNTDGPRFASSPTPGEWWSRPFGHGQMTAVDVTIARSDWFARVREPLGTLRYLHLEVPIPAPGHPLGKAAARLRDAEQSLTAGDEPGVFLHCRGAIDALPGMPRDVFADLGDAREAKTLDDLVKAVGAYLHRGRHVEREGDRQGEFPVDSRDARFALNMTKVLVAHVAARLTRT
jgi:hypothetical protein